MTPTILRVQPVSDRQTCNTCTQPNADRIKRTMHWRDASRVWRCEVCEPFVVVPMSAPSAEPPLSADLRDASPGTELVAPTQRESVSGGALSSVARRAVEHFGAESQCAQAIEECAELIVALRHWDRGRCFADDVAAEVADVSIMLDQLAHIVGRDLVAAAKAKKLEALEKLIVSEVAA